MITIKVTFDDSDLEPHEIEAVLDQVSWLGRKELNPGASHPLK